MNSRTRMRIRQINQIKGQLATKGYTLSDIDRQYKLPKNACSRALSEPNPNAEKAIAETLGVHPMALWAERYDPVTGQRLSPQPLENYERPPTLSQRRNMQGSSTGDQSPQVMQS